MSLTRRTAKRFIQNVLRISILITTLTNLFSSCQVQSDHSNIKSIQDVMKKVCDYQLNNFSDTTVMSNGISEAVPETGWIRGAFYTGVVAVYEATGEEQYLQHAINWGKGNLWQLGPKKRHADDHAVAQTYLQLYELKKEAEMIAHTQSTFDEIVDQPMSATQFGWSKSINWSWCDALFMAPPAYAMLSEITDNIAYIEAMDKMWWETSAYLYDKQDSLFYRDSVYKPNVDGTEKREPNGKKVFWGRGNGWVLAGLAKVLTYMPEDYSGRSKFIDQYREMAVKIKSLQAQDGLWRSSLYDPESFPDPETSGSSFYCYALAWGINNGILSEQEFKPVVLKAWKSLVANVNEEGKLGFVQKVGHAPSVVLPDDTNEYAAGGFLNAGLEVIKLIDDSKILGYDKKN